MKAARALYITNLGLLDNLAQTQVLPYLEGLSKNSVKIDILSFEKKENLRDRACVDRMKNRLRSSGIEWSCLPYHRRWGNVWDVISGMAKSFCIVRKKKIGILHARASIPILIAWPIAKLLRRKIIYDRRGTMAGDFVDDVNVANIFSIKAFRYILNVFENLIIRHSDAVIVLSEKALELLKKDPEISRKHIAVEAIPCCVDRSRFTGNVNAPVDALELKDKFTICYLGSLGTCYLLKEMALFFKELKKIKTDAFFLIISHTGKGYINDTLTGQGLQSGSDYRIIDLTPDQVGQYLSLSKFGIMFIKPVECKIGSSPTKFAESLASGVPVVVNKGIGDTEDIIRERKVGVVAEGLDTHFYDKAIEEMMKLVKTGGLKDRCIETANEYFSLDLGIGRYLNVYRKIG